METYDYADDSEDDDSGRFDEGEYFGRSHESHQIADKRERNKIHARNTRARKKQKMMELENRVKQLEQENSELMVKVGPLSTEKTSIDLKNVGDIQVEVTQLQSRINHQAIHLNSLKAENQKLLEDNKKLRRQIHQLVGDDDDDNSKGGQDETIDDAVMIADAGHKPANTLPQPSKRKRGAESGTSPTSNSTSLLDTLPPQEFLVEMRNAKLELQARHRHTEMLLEAFDARFNTPNGNHGDGPQPSNNPNGVSYPFGMPQIYPFPSSGRLGLPLMFPMTTQPPNGDTNEAKTSGDDDDDDVGECEDSAPTT